MRDRRRCLASLRCRLPGRGRSDSLSPGSLLALGVIIGLGVFGFETAVHGAHHVADPGAAAQCDVAAAAAHIISADVPSAPAESPVMRIGDALAGDHLQRAKAPTLHAHRGRAPPVALL